MGNKIRIKQIDLQGIFSASGQVNLLSASNYAEFVTQLDTTMSSDSELAAVSSSISQSIYTITQTLGIGLVTTSSFNSFTASYNTGSFSGSFNGDGSELYNLSSNTNWNYNQEYTIRKTEQLTFSGDYILSSSYLLIEGDDEEIEYSQNKSFKKGGSIFIGGNLLVKDSTIVNNGRISVGGEVILIGNSDITGTGTII